MNIIRIATHGGPDVLAVATTSTPEPGPGQVRVRVAAAGVNFIDTYHRTGLYPIPLPFTPGQEGAGTITAVGSGVTLTVGTRVAWAGAAGSYAEEVVIPAHRAAPVPDGVSDTDAAAAMLQGMTAHYLTHDTFALTPGHVCLVHAAAGGTGQLVAQLARARGATVIGTVSTDEKEAIALASGCHEVLRYDGFAAAVKRLHGGAHVVYDGVGAATFNESLDALRLRGTMVLFGAASGPVPPFDPSLLNTKGSLFLTRPSLFHYVATPEEYAARATAVLAAVGAGTLRIRVSHTFPLADAAEAHRVLEGRGTTGKILLIP
jgi:NADPH2:quinone reductase